MTTRTLTEDQGTALLEVAGEAIREAIEHGGERALDDAEFDEALRRPGASFVTLERGGRLLGCIGSLEPIRSLVADVARNAVAAAFRDPRLPPVSASDYRVMSIEISVLGPLEPMTASTFPALVNELRPGTDGLLVDAAHHRATFLPAVWGHFGDRVEPFLDALWRKAGLAPASWPEGTRCSRYTAEKIVDPGPRAPAG